MLIGEELAWGCAAIATTLGTNELAAAPVLLGGSEQDQGQVPGKAHGGAQSSPRSVSQSRMPGSDVSAMRTTAVRKADKYVINGSKMFISNGGYADWYTVYAKTDKDGGHRGISAFVVPRDDTVRVDKHEDKMGLRASNTRRSASTTPRFRQNLLGDENHGFKLAMMTLDRTRPAWPQWQPASLGSIRVCHRVCEAADPVRCSDRHAPGDPVHDRRHATDIEAARLLTRQSALLLDQGQRNTLQSSHAKRFAADTAMNVATDAVQVYAATGSSRTTPSRS